MGRPEHTFSILVVLRDVIPFITLDALSADEMANGSCVLVKFLFLPPIDKPGHAVSIHHGKYEGCIIVQIHFAFFDGSD